VSALVAASEDGGLVIYDEDPEIDGHTVSVRSAPGFLREVAEATATACGWNVPDAAEVEGTRIGGSRRPIVCVTIGEVEHAVDPVKARALAVALLRAADEAEASK
jgi:hypothetical protein